MALGIGDRLRATRRQQQLTLAQAAAEIRVREPYLAALEEEKFSALGGDVYVRAFLRGYSEYLGLDPDQMVDAYRRQHENGNGHAAEPANQQTTTLSRPRTTQVSAGVYDEEDEVDEVSPPPLSPAFQPQGARPASARPQGARPQGARAQGARPQAPPPPTSVGSGTPPPLARPQPQAPPPLTPPPGWQDEEDEGRGGGGGVPRRAAILAAAVLIIIGIAVLALRFLGGGDGGGVDLAAEPSAEEQAPPAEQSVQPSADAAAPPAAEEEATPEIVQAPPEELQGAQPPASDQPAAPPPPAGPLTDLNVEVRVPDAESWMRITVDGVEQEEGLQPPGTVLTYDADQSVVMRIGDASRVQILLNGVDQGEIGPPTWTADIEYRIGETPVVTTEAP
jgi:transcriptional regulator with XRE-family HTH domain